MCGITGFIGNIENKQNIIHEMSDTLVHRGPDSSGIWIDESLGVALGHRRLAIQDLSSAGHQPMKSHSGRYIICFNGEIYNHFEIRKKIEKNYKNTINWIGHSDTETVLTAIESLGLDSTLSSIKGMFALSIWDKKEKVLTLARDRMGEKPLYYGFVNNNLVFGSELKAIRKFPEFNNKISKSALLKYFKYSYIPTPTSIFENIYKLEPAHYIQFKLKGQGSVNQSTTSQSFWSFKSTLENAQSKPFANSYDLNSSLESSLEQAISSQLISDVPVGTFLSGGIDSSLITSLLQKNSMLPVKTFTIGFEDKNYDESKYAASISNHLGTDHHQMVVGEKDILETIFKLPQIYDEPFADSSQIPTTLVSQLARERVTVALSGDAGDELFGGYNRYTHTPQIWNSISFLPFILRRFVGNSIRSIGPERYDALGKVLSPIKILPQLGSKIHKMADRMITINSLEEFCLSLATIWQNPYEIVKDANQIDDIQMFNFSDFDFLESDIQKMMAIDALTYLPDDILCKVDRASMSTSLETRVPFLDIEVIKVAARIPIDQNISGRLGKLPLRNLLAKYVPSKLIDRPKAGFAIPIGSWLGGPLRDWAESLIDERIIKEAGLLNYDTIKKTWDDHLSGKADFTPRIWNVLMLQSWLKDIEPSI